ncbi:MAG: hypothetical protein FMNOHCHN_01629 [Ignavibacteriaceae bacterium]|nr:hypothetical protein [Ignavibacteriaceae bacterium]
MTTERQLLVIMLVTLLLITGEFAGLERLRGLTMLPWSGDIYTAEAGRPVHLLPVLFYGILLPVLFAVSLRGLLRLRHADAKTSAYALSVSTWSMLLSIYIIFLFLWQSSSAAAMITEHQQTREKMQQSVMRDVLLLELNEVCFLTREKMLLPDSLGGIGKNFSVYAGKETGLLKKILGNASFAALDKIMISGLNDTSISFTAISRDDLYTFDARVINNNSQIIYEQLPVSGEQK